MARLVVMIVVASLVALVSAQEAARAEFQSCQGCSLNALPEVKRFLRDEIEQGKWERSTVTWIPGATPELILFDAEDKEIERIGLRDKNNFDTLVALMGAKGFSRAQEGGNAGVVEEEELSHGGRELKQLARPAGAGKSGKGGKGRHKRRMGPLAREPGSAHKGGAHPGTAHAGARPGAHPGAGKRGGGGGGGGGRRAGPGAGAAAGGKGTGGKHVRLRRKWAAPNGAGNTAR